MELPIPVWASIAAGGCALVGAVIGASVNPYITSRLNERTRRLDLYKIVYPQKIEAAKQLMQQASELRSSMGELHRLLVDEVVGEGENARHSTNLTELIDSVWEKAEALDRFSDSISWLMHFRVQAVTLEFTQTIRKQTAAIYKSMVRDAKILEAELKPSDKEIQSLMEKVERHNNYLAAQLKDWDAAGVTDASANPDEVLKATNEFKQAKIALDQAQTLVGKTVTLVTDVFGAKSLADAAMKERIDLVVTRNALQELWKAVRDETHIVEFDELFSNNKKRDQWVDRRRKERKK